jgi:hypothetical protein
MVAAKYAKKIAASVLLASAVGMLLFCGCYTRLMTYQGEVTEAGSKGSDGCADCREEVPYTGGRQVCVWERDMFGYPELRCYYTNYASSWLYFHNTPWWYRSSYGWHDTRGCPPYYYYDRISGTCRYYVGASYPGPNPGTGGGGIAGTDRPKPRMRGITSGATDKEPPPPAEGSGLAPMFSGSANKILSPAGSAVTPSPTQPSSSSATSNSNAGMSKPHGGEGQQSTPTAEQKPAENKPVDKKERPRPSMRGM